MSVAVHPKVKEALTKYGIEAKILPCESEFADTAAFCEKYGYTAEQSANTILVINKKNRQQIVACVLLASTRLDVNKKVCELMGTKRASFASADETVQATGMEIGGVTVFGLPTDMTIYVDERVMHQPEIIMGGGNRTSKLVLKPAELNKITSVKIIENIDLDKI